jgi:hypothetical protein
MYAVSSTHRDTKQRRAYQGRSCAALMRQPLARAAADDGTATQQGARGDPRE